MFDYLNRWMVGYIQCFVLESIATKVLIESAVKRMRFNEMYACHRIQRRWESEKEKESTAQWQRWTIETTLGTVHNNSIEKKRNKKNSSNSERRNVSFVKTLERETFSFFCAIRLSTLAQQITSPSMAIITLATAFTSIRTHVLDKLSLLWKTKLWLLHGMNEKKSRKPFDFLFFSFHSFVAICDSTVQIQIGKKCGNVKGNFGAIKFRSKLLLLHLHRNRFLIGHCKKSNNSWKTATTASLRFNSIQPNSIRLWACFSFVFILIALLLCVCFIEFTTT